MPSPIKFKRQDPNKTKSRNRGQGWYYKRGGYKRNWFSKYSGQSDGKVKPKTIRKKLNPQYEHTADKFKGRTTRKLKLSPRSKGRRIRGFL